MKICCHKSDVIVIVSVTLIINYILGIIVWYQVSCSIVYCGNYGGVILIQSLDVGVQLVPHNTWCRAYVVLALMESIKSLDNFIKLLWMLEIFFWILEHFLYLFAWIYTSVGILKEVLLNISLKKTLVVIFVKFHRLKNNSR